MTEPNVLLDALIEEAGFSHSGFAARVNEYGRRHGVDLRYDHASVARWVRDHAVPRGEVPEIICEILSSRLGRAITLASAGLDRSTVSRLGNSSLAQAVDRAVAFWRGDAQGIRSQADKPVLGGADAIAPVFE